MRLTVRLPLFVVVALVVAWLLPLSAQTRRGTPPPPARGRAPALVTEPAKLECPTVLGQGASTGRTFCDVLIGRDPAAGIIIPLPPHTGDVTLMFDLHNRHTYSEDEIKSKRAFRRYTASIGVLTMDNTLITRAVVQNEFRAQGDLIDRVLGGSGPGGLKAVAPTGSESIVVTIDAPEQAVSILGEKLSVIRMDGKDDYQTMGRPIAVISNVVLEYRPAPAARGRGTGAK